MPLISRGSDELTGVWAFDWYGVPSVAELSIIPPTSLKLIDGIRVGSTPDSVVSCRLTNSGSGMYCGMVEQEYLCFSRIGPNHFRFSVKGDPPDCDAVLTDHNSIKIRCPGDRGYGGIDWIMLGHRTGK